ncbi:hypothetical protein GWG54_08425 [Natronococcus sp. JC468]|uniref:DUF7344 domain-containing protein n=1 Tax=Natronococcus sp. JC468 TaxID=1961921 RepID=UPI00143C0DD1|nr:hypothetical protein [Natronococcus sp. JC468]NKE35845.1 hypothetical protein [Natronococcus sp. JC468]
MVGSTIEFDTVLELCQEQHRRIILATLTHEKRSVTVTDLTKTILKHNHHTPLAAVSEEESKRIRLALHHVHLPKLAEQSIVGYDRERQLVKPTPQFDQLQPQLSAIIDADPDLDAPISP